jgi:hypothetical protein
MAGLWIVAGVCFFAGSLATNRLLPEFAEGPVGFVALALICGLGGAAIAELGVHIDGIVRILEGPGGNDRTTFVGAELESMLSTSGLLAGLAMIVLILAPKPREPRETPSAAT